MVGSEVVEDWEGCLSIPDIRGRVPRARDIRVLANLHDMTINQEAIEELVRHWKERGAAVSYYTLSDTLKLPHDIVDPDEKGSKTEITNSVILALLRGQTPRDARPR